MHLKHIIFLLLSSCLSFSQTKNNLFFEKSIGNTPKVINYTRNDFKGDPQFWTMCEAPDKSLIFGNNDGALIFDGEHWDKVSLPNNSNVRCIVKTTDDKIYVGGFNEIGVLEKNKFGRYFYKSLLNEFHLKDRNLENLWQVHQNKNLIIYRSFLQLIVINGNRVTQLPPNKIFSYAATIGEHYFVQDLDHGIYKLNSKTINLELVFDNKETSNDELVSILPTKNPNIILLVSKSGMIYTGDISKKAIISKKFLFSGEKVDQITSAISLDNYDYLFGTLSTKIIRLNHSGSIDRGDATFPNLANNASIHFLFQTANKNIWVLQNKGLSFIDFKSPFISVFDQGSVYDILVKDNIVYVATNNGVFYSKFSSNKNSFNFIKIGGIQGQSWRVQNFENDILVSHDNGIYKIVDGTAQKIGTESGFWKITKIKEKPGFYLASNYVGLYLLQKDGNNWKIINKIKGFDESSRDILADNTSNTYWICHGYKGVFKVHLNSDYSRVDAVDHFTDKNGFTSPYNINVFKWKGKIVFTTNTGIYVYNNQTNRFVPYAPLNKLFDSTKNTRKILENENKTWFIQDDEAGYFNTNSENPKLNKDLFLNLKGTFNRGTESIYPLKDKVFFGTNSGLFLYTIFNNQVTEKYPTIITQINFTHNQKTNLIEIKSDKNSISLPNQTDILRFEFSSPKMISSTEINYSYKLEKVDENWSPWQKNAYKEYTHLRPGDYVFVVKSRNFAGLVGEEARCQFTILPKWYQTNLAYFLYFIIGISSIYFLRRYVTEKIAFERLKSKIEVKKTQQLLELEMERLKLKHDKEEIYKDKLTLEEDIIGKSKELANYTLLLSQKKNAFTDLQVDLKQLRELLKNEESKRKITEIFQKLNQHKIGEEYMEIFDVNFEKINHDFFEKLKKIDSNLTKRELRLCAFIKMDLSNKEISPLLGISIRGVETARYKIRKKLNINHEENFHLFFEERI